MQKEFHSILRDIEMKNLKPVYLLHGEEPYFIDIISEAFETKVLDEVSRDFGQTIVYGRDVSMDQVVGLAKSFPMMGDRQLVIVKEAQDMKEWKKTDDESEEKSADKEATKSTKKKSEPKSPLEVYLSNPTPSTILIFCFKGKLDKRFKLGKMLVANAEVFESTVIREEKIPDWLMQYCKQRGYQMQSDAASLMATYLGNDLGKLVNAIAKLAILLPPGSTLTTQHVADNIGISKDYNVWALQSALANKNALLSYRIIHYFESNPKANPIQMVLPSLYSYFLKLYLYKLNLSNKEVIDGLKLNYYQQLDFRQAIKLYPDRKMEKIISTIRLADKQLKGIGYRMEEGEIMKELVFKILH